MNFKILLIFIALFFSLSGVASEVRHVAFLLHGFNSSSEYFCDFEKLLQKKLDSSGVKIVSLDYEAFSQNLGVADFTYDISKSIQDEFQKLQLDDDTPFSIIGHSQGGLIALKYIQRCILEERKKCGPAKKNLQQLITLGSPFWGSPTANQLLLAKIADLPLKQFKDLRYSSASIVSMRKHLIRKKYNQFWKNLRIYNIGGEVLQNNENLKNPEKMITKLFDEEESDTVVPPSASNMNFYYTIENKDRSGYKNGKINYSDHVSFYSIPHSDLSIPIVNKDGTPGLSCFQEENKTTKKLLSYIERTYMNLFDDAPISQPNTRLKKRIRNFTVEIRFRLPLQFKRPINVSKDMIKTSELNTQKVKSQNIRDSFLSVNNQFVSKEANLTKMPTFFHTGRFKKNFHYNPKYPGENLVKIEYEVNIPGFNSKKFYLFAEPGHHSYAEIDLQPSRPFRSRGPMFFNDKKLNRLLFSYTHNKSGKKSYLVGLFEDATNKTRLQSWDKGHWNTFLSKKINHTKNINLNKCYLAKIGKQNKYHSNKVYSNAFDTKSIDQMVEGSKVIVVGRIGKARGNNEHGDNKSYDRSLITLSNPYWTYTQGISSHSFFWIDSKNIDINTDSSVCEHPPQ